MNTLNQRFNLNLNSPKAQRAGDVGWMVDCEVAEISNLAHSVNTGQISLPRWLSWAFVDGKNFFRVWVN